MRNSAISILAVLALSACATAEPPASGRQALTGCDHVSGWCDQIRRTAAETWRHAQISANAYADGPVFDLGPEFAEVERHDNDDLGFAYIVVKQTPASGPTQWILGFRGTEGADFPDWWHGNILGRQNARGLAAFDRLAAAAGEGASIAVTGHSLGGGIATEVSLCRDVEGAFVFNPSPRFRACTPQVDNPRQSVVEYGELLKVGRVFGREATQTYTSIGCSKGDPIHQHQMALLASCLTQIAAWSDVEARASLRRNRLPWPDGLPVS